MLDNKDELCVTDKTFQRYLNNKYNQNRINLDEILAVDYQILDTRQSDLRIYSGVCPTLRTGRHGLVYTKNHKLIKLSGLESLLLQGFPKDFLNNVKYISNSKLLSQAGNAMTVNVIEEIGKSIVKYVNKDETDG